MIDPAALLGNQVFAGVAGAAILSGALFQLRAVPAALWAVACDQFSASLTVYSEQDVYRRLDLWLSRHPHAKKSRRLNLTEWWDQSSQTASFEMTPGEGPHLLWEGRSPVFVYRQVEAAQPGAAGSNGLRRQTLRMVTIGRSRARLEKLVEEARTVEDRDVVPIYVWGGHGYTLIERRPRRDMATIYLAEGLKERIVADARRFLDRRAWYSERGVPHRRGYLFEGPPGTGKSSMALALAGELHRAIYIINPAAAFDDNALLTAINQAGSGLVLIEDIDAVESGHARVEPHDQMVSASPGMPTPRASTGITTSGLLNAIDGVGARNGRILVITSNHADHLDPALVRPGRVDMHCHFGLATRPEAEAMFRGFCPGHHSSTFDVEIGAHLPLSQAEVQNRLLRLAA